MSMSSFKKFIQHPFVLCAVGINLIFGLVVGLMGSHNTAPSFEPKAILTTTSNGKKGVCYRVTKFRDIECEIIDGWRVSVFEDDTGQKIVKIHTEFNTTYIKVE